MTQVSCAVFTDFPLARLKILEQVAAMANLHHDVHELVVFENIEQPDDVRVLTHLQDLDLPVLQEVVRLIHHLLVDDLNCHVLARLDVRSQLH